MTGKARVAEEENLIRNGDFSQGEEHWTLVPNGPDTIRIVEDYCQAGSGAYAFQDVPIKVGGTYRVTFNGRLNHRPERPSSGVLEVVMRPSGRTQEFRFDEFWQWTPYVYEFTVPATETAVTVKLQGIGFFAYFNELVMVLEKAEEDDELIKNGNFTEKGKHWQAFATPPASISFDDRYCVATRNAYAEQEVTIDPDKKYRFSLDTTISNGGAGTALLEMQPSRQLQVMSFHDNHPCTTRVLEFTTPAGTSAVRVLLLGGEGGVCFDNASLKRVR